MFRSWPFLFLWVASAAYAAPGDPAPPGSQPEYGVMPMASEGSDPRLERRLSRQEVPKQDRRRTRPSAVMGIQGGVPIFVGSDVDRNVVRPGGSFTFLTGADLGYFAPEIGVGYMANRIDPSNVSSTPLQRVNLGIGGRLQVPNASVLIPYLSAAFAAQWWKFDTFAGGCSFACPTGSGFRFAPGLNFRVGTTITISRSVAIDIGLGYSLSFQGNGVFTQNRNWIEPSFGFRFWI